MNHHPEKAYAGYTLYTSGHSSSAFLIDMEGHICHEWHLPFEEAWPTPIHLAYPVPERFIFWRRAHVFPNGDLIAIYVGTDTPWGYGLVKLDRNSKLIWKYAANAHHDFCIAPDGTIILLTHRFRETNSNPVANAPHLPGTVLDDYVVRLSAEGEQLQEVSILDAIAKSKSYHHLLTPIPQEDWDILHTNTVEYVTPEFAHHHDFAEAGQIMVSIRSRDALAILDLKDAEVVWAIHGPFRGQHDPDVLDNGNILLFDNLGNTGVGGPSRVIEISAESGNIQWQYGGDSKNYFFSWIRSVQQRLPNDNVLITESSAGRILEVTRAGEIVWEFRNPLNLDGDDCFIPILCGAVRITPEALHFEMSERRLPQGGEGKERKRK